MTLHLVAALELMPWLDWRTLLQLRATSRTCDVYEVSRQLAYEMHQRSIRQASLALLFSTQGDGEGDGRGSLTDRRWGPPWQLD